MADEYFSGSAMIAFPQADFTLLIPLGCGADILFKVDSSLITNGPRVKIRVSASGNFIAAPDRPQEITMFLSLRAFQIQ